MLGKPAQNTFLSVILMSSVASITFANINSEAVEKGVGRDLPQIVQGGRSTLLTAMSLSNGLSKGCATPPVTEALRKL
jgi:hypothetical protein